MNPRTVCLLPAHLVHDLGQRRAVVPLEQGDHLGRLATFAHSLGLRFGRGRLLGPGGLGGRLGFLRRNDGRLCANGGHSLGGFGSGPAGLVYEAYGRGFGCWGLTQRSISVNRPHWWLRARGSSGPFSEALDGLPDALGGDLPSLPALRDRER